MIAISLFSGCGGLDFGIEEARWEIVFRKDFDSHSCSTLGLNCKGDILCAPVEEVSAEDIRKSVGSDKIGAGIRPARSLRRNNRAGSGMVRGTRQKGA